MVSAVLKACRSTSTQAAIAVAMGTSETTLSNMLSKDLDRLCLLLAHSGLKIVPNDAQCFSRDKVHALLTLARDHLVQMEHPEQLSWD